MKHSLSLGLIVAVSSTFAACSSDEGADREPAPGTAGTVGVAGTTGSGVGGTGAGGTGSGGTGTGGTGTGGSTGTPPTYGATLTITEDGNVEDPTAASQVDGGFFLAQSDNMTVDAVAANRAGGLCFSGSTAVVPDTNSYGTYWGAELGLDLLRVPVGGGAPPPAPVADAGADAGGPVIALEAGPWPYGNVIGFSYRVVGNDTAAADRGVPATRVRFKALPVGSNGENDTYCSLRDGLVDGAVENVLFDDITFECWQTDNPSIGPNEPTINRVNPGPPRVVETPPNPRQLVSVSWQVSSDIAATTPAPIAFNFCITELKPILAP